MCLSSFCEDIIYQPWKNPIRAFVCVRAYSITSTLSYKTIDDGL